MKYSKLENISLGLEGHIEITTVISRKALYVKVFLYVVWTLIVRFPAWAMAQIASQAYVLAPHSRWYQQAGILYCVKRQNETAKQYSCTLTRAVSGAIWVSWLLLLHLTMKVFNQPVSEFPSAPWTTCDFIMQDKVEGQLYPNSHHGEAWVQVLPELSF